MVKPKWTPVLLIATLLVSFFAVSTESRVYATVSSVDDWPMFHRDPAHTGYTPSAGPTATPAKVWSCEITSDVEATSPTVTGDYVFVTDQIFTYCLNVSTGAELWRAAGGRGSTPVVYGGYVYTGSGDCTAYNASTGAVVWNLKPLGFGGGLVGAVVNGVVYVAALLGNAYALNALTGAIIWNYTTGARSAPAFAGGYVYFGTVGTVCALNAYTGAKVWEYEAKAHVESSPAVADGYVYVGVDGIVALNASTGTTIWNYTNGNPVYTSSSPAVANGYVYIGSTPLDNNVYAFNASTGNKIWNYTTGFWVHSSPAVADGVVYIGSDDGNLYALNASTGTKLWNYTIQPILGERGFSRYLHASPAIVNGIIYMGSTDGDVYALGATSNTTPSPTPSPITPEPPYQILIIALTSIIIVAAITVAVVVKRRTRRKTG
jgi:outer membrane protein assembly factor BamB